MLKSLQAVTFVKKIAKVTACILLITSCDQLICPQSIQSVWVENRQSDTLLKRAIYSAVFQLDPHKIKASADAAPLRDLLVGLTAYNRKGDVVPAIAQNWFTEDEKEWLFILDEKAVWSNGQPVTAQDFVASWRRLINPQNHSVLSKYLIYMGIENAKAIEEQIKSVEELGVEALNAHTLRIRLNHPNHQLPEMLAHSALLPTYQGIAPTIDNFVSNASYRLEKLRCSKNGVKGSNPRNSLSNYRV